MVLWAFGIWLWARTLLDIRFPEPLRRRASYNFWRRHLPRFLGLGAFVVVGAAASLAGVRGLLVYAELWGAAFLSFVIYRRPLANATARWLERRGSRGRLVSALHATAIGPDEEPPFGTLPQALWGPRGWFAVATMVAGLILFVLGTFAPVVTGTWLGAVFLFFLWGATWRRWGVPSPIWAPGGGGPC